MDNTDEHVPYNETSAIPVEQNPKSPPAEIITVCKCLLSNASSSDAEEIPKRKQNIFSTVTRTENYLRERRIPELIRFLLAKIIASGTTNPAEFGMKLLDDCMLCRAGLGQAPVVFEDRHLEAVVNSFDPGRRGWLSPGQVRRAFTTLGLTLDESLFSYRDKIPTDEVFETLRKTQKTELYHLLCAGTNLDEESTVASVSTLNK